jgi:hypothetical protein
VKSCVTVACAALLVVVEALAAAPAPDLRAKFDAHEVTAAPIGRVAVRLLNGDDGELVPIDRVFHAGERFQFEIMFNVSGWVSVAQPSPSGELQILWPPHSDPDAPTAQRVEADTAYLIPPGQSAFRFDHEAGIETFFIAITSTHDAVHPDQSAAAEPNAIPTKQAKQYLLRQLIVEADRGAILDPGPKGADPYVYFSTTQKDVSAPAVMRVKLRHGK